MAIELQQLDVLYALLARGANVNAQHTYFNRENNHVFVVVA
jgi:hypothetical protein